MNNPSHKSPFGAFANGKPSAPSEAAATAPASLHGLKTKLKAATRAAAGRGKESVHETYERVISDLAPIRQEAILSYFELHRGRILKTTATNPTTGGANPFHAHFAAHPITLDEGQQLAVDLAVKHQYFNLVGAAGSGKTATTAKITSRLIDEGIIPSIRDDTRSRHLPNLDHLGLDGDNYNVIFCAFTGMAVKNIRKNLPRAFADNCATIHKVLDYGREVIEVPATAKDVIEDKASFVGQMIPRNRFVPRITRENPIAPAVIVIDEASMLGLNLAEQLFTAIHEDTRVIIVGDLAQLKPVMDTSVQPFALHAWPRVELTRIYRQREGDIIDAATRIRHGKAPLNSANLVAKQLDRSPIKAQKQVISLMTDALSTDNYNPYLDIGLTPWNVQDVGTNILNTLTRMLVNPNAKRRLVKTQKSNYIYSIRDRVVITKNNSTLGVYNGMLGTIISIRPNKPLDFDDNADETANTSALSPDGKPAETSINFDLLDSAMENLTAAKLADPTETTDSEGEGSRKASHAIAVLLDQDLTNHDENWVMGEIQHTQAQIASGKLDAATAIDELIERLSEPDNFPDPSSAARELSTSSNIENLSLAYWVTVNKSQGSGFRNVFVVVHDQHAVSLCNELLYTAVTRTQNAVQIMTTGGAILKCLQRFTYKGANLDEKIANYLAEARSRLKLSDCGYVEISADDLPAGAHVEVIRDISELPEENRWINWLPEARLAKPPQRPLQPLQPQPKPSSYLIPDDELLTRENSRENYGITAITPHVHRAVSTPKEETMSIHPDTPENRKLLMEIADNQRERHGISAHNQNRDEANAAGTNPAPTPPTPPTPAKPNPFASFTVKRSK